MKALEPLRAAGRLVRNAIRGRLGRADYRRWSSPQGLELWWEERTRVIAELLPPASRVIEFGAGRRQLERLLGPDCVYFPSDLVERGPGTLVCDLNRRPLPSLRALGPDVAVFGGVLEYVVDVQSVVRWLAENDVGMCIVSFDGFPEGLSRARRAKERLRRRYFGYMNDLSREALVRIFARAGMTCAETRPWTTQVIYRFVRAGMVPDFAGAEGRQAGSRANGPSGCSDLPAAPQAQDQPAQSS